MRSCVCAQDHMSDFLQPRGLQPSRLLSPWNFPGKGIGVGSHALLRRNFSIQGLNLRPLHCRWILYHWTTWKAHQNIYIYIWMPKSVHDFWSYWALRGEQDLENREERTLAPVQGGFGGFLGVGSRGWKVNKGQRTIFFYSEKYQVKESWVSPQMMGMTR